MGAFYLDATQSYPQARLQYFHGFPSFLLSFLFPPFIQIYIHMYVYTGCPVTVEYSLPSPLVQPVTGHPVFLENEIAEDLILLSCQASLVLFFIFFL